MRVGEISGSIRKAELTPASDHDSRFFAPLLSGDECSVYAAPAYDDTARRQRFNAKGMMDGKLKKARRHTPLTEWKRTWNHYLSAIRSPVERVFDTLKTRYGFRHAAYAGYCAIKTRYCCFAWPSTCAK